MTVVSRLTGKGESDPHSLQALPFFWCHRWSGGAQRLPNAGYGNPHLRFCHQNMYHGINLGAPCQVALQPFSSSVWVEFLA